MYQSISFYRFYIGMIVTVKMSSSWPSSLLKTIFVEDNIDFTLSLISCHSLSSPKRLAHFRWTSLYLGWSIIIHWKITFHKWLPSPAFIQSSLFCRTWPKIFQVQLFKTLRSKNHISIQSGSIWSWIDPFHVELKYDKILSILNSPVLIFYIIYI